ncbi:MAG TPA: KamA family radical SAM protein [Desulfobacterales bacterium]|nr:KamA family radical SAM protein [Desulfobacterales bacterium]
MKKQQIKTRLRNILSIAPQLHDIIVSFATVEEIKDDVHTWLSDILAETYKDNSNIKPLEYILVHDAINVFRRILSDRSEKLAGYSFIGYLVTLLTASNDEVFERPTAGFFAELERLVRGIMGTTGIYNTKTPAFSKHEGRKAARMRSADLSRMARASQKFMNSYTCGLENDAVRRRSRNKARIINFFGITDLEWEKWEWHLKNSIRDADTLKKLVKLTDEEYEAVRRARDLKIPFAITPYYLSLMDLDSGGHRDKVIRAQVIPSLHYVNKLAEHKHNQEHSMDFMLEYDTSPIEGVTRRYPNVVILKPVMTCPQICVYCQRNWEIEDVDSASATLPKSKLEAALDWIKNTPEINEVLITGGDPLMLSNQKLESIVSRVAANPKIIRIRIGTRTLVTMPQRITESLVRGLSRFQIPGKREVVIITHFEHSYEITPQSMAAVQKFRRNGMEVYNQLVFTYYNSRKFEACFLRQQLRLIGVTPYYTFNAKGKAETSDFRVPLARLMQEQKEEARLMPGTVRTDEIVFNVPGLGKNYLKASQNHDIISITPDGRRVYEFHPWEEKLALANTYLYKDVSIYDYLKRLKSDGQDISAYRTIWYYY